MPRAPRRRTAAPLGAAILPTVLLCLAAGAVGGCRDRGADTPGPSASRNGEAGADDRAMAQRPDVLLVTIDTLRADHTSAYGYEIPTTPVLERLAAEGVLYRRMYAASATTGPAHAAIMTSMHPRSLAYLKNGHILRREFRTLAEVLSDAGYETAAFVSSMPVGSRFGFGQGFDYYNEDESARTSLKRNRQIRLRRYGDETVDALGKWLRARSRPRPLFVWLHLFDPHSPYQPPPGILDATWPRRTPKSVIKYDGEIRFADLQLGRAVALMREVAGERGVLTTVTADHGEGLGDHDWRGHGANLHEEAVRVPLVLHWPGRLEPAESPALAAHIDVAPTILSLLEISMPGSFVGSDLSGAVDEDRAVFIQRRDYSSRRERGKVVNGEMIAVVRGRYKYIRSPSEKRFELYDLRTDPKELDNLAESKKILRGKLEKLVRQWVEDTPVPTFEQPQLSDEDRDALRALGYVD